MEDRLPGGFTAARWRANPFQMLGLSAVGVWAIAVLSDRDAYIEAIPESEINNPAMVNIFAAGMLVGVVISLLGLHGVDREFSAWSEASGYLIVMAASAIFVSLMFYYLGLQAALVRPGTATTAAYVVAMGVRLFQISVFLRGLRRVDHLHDGLIEQIKSAQ